MTGIELQEQLENVRMRLLEAIAPLPDEALTDANAVEHMSIRELLFLLTAWDSELVTGLMRIRQGKQPKRLLDALADREQYERTQLATASSRDLDQIFDDLQHVRIELEEWLTQFSDRELNDRRRYSWLRDRTLFELIADNSLEHELRFVPVVEAYANAWMSTSHISLNSIEVTGP